MRKLIVTLGTVLIFLAAAVPAIAAADWPGAAPVKDPSAASRAVYGRIGRSGETDFFAVTPRRQVDVTVEAVVPVRQHSADFRPTVAIAVPGSSSHASVPFPVPSGFGTVVVPPNPDRPGRTLFDPNSIERFYRNGSATVSLPGGRTSYLAVYDPTGGTGDYVLGVASSAYYENASRADLLAQGIALKFGAAPGRVLPWWDVLGAALAVLGIAGAAAVGLALFWPRPKAAKRLVRLHRLTVGSAFVAVGAFYAGLRILGRLTGMIAVASFQEILAVLLLLAALWLALQKADQPAGYHKYKVFIALWGAGWLAETFLLAWYLLVTRVT